MQTMNAIDMSVFSKEEVLQDYRIAFESRQASLTGRKEVFMGKAKFGIFGDGKEIAQLAMARIFRNGDFRSGYYRDQTFMLAIGALSLEAFFAQLYAHTDVEAEPATAGRCMNAHFSTRSLHEDGTWKDLTSQKNSSADISCTAGQMPRLVGLAYASKLYRQNKSLHHLTQFSIKGNEIAFGTIGNASAAEGHFFEAINAAGVLQVPMLMSVWDDGYGISVPNHYQMTKSNVSEVLKGFQRDEHCPGYEIFTVKGWDYPSLVDVYKKAESICRGSHIPVLIHVTELTQPQGHSTSGSHERYKSEERLAWEAEHDCLAQMRNWILHEQLASISEIEQIEEEASKRVKEARKNAWTAFSKSMEHNHQEAINLLKQASILHPSSALLRELYQGLDKAINPIRMDAVKAVRRAIYALKDSSDPIRQSLKQWLETILAENQERYSSHLYSQSAEAAIHVQEVPAIYENESAVVDAREIMQACFDDIFTRDSRVFAIGEDVGKIGDVNQGFAGLQEKHGELRITDTGIRETTIIGQGIGAAMRGLRPIVEIQYLDYIYYAVQTLADDLACLQYRTKGGQKAPLIVRTRGHRLEGIWHSGSPIGMLINSLRGMLLLVPRNMTKAAGFYNTLLKSDEPAVIIECLNGYRLKERMPKNIGSICTPVGVVETIREGRDLTVVTYGSMCRIVQEAGDLLASYGIEIEIIDVQSLIPFDLGHDILKSIKKTNRVIFADEDVSGGATGYMMQKVLDEQGAYQWLDAKPVCISAKDHRPAYASDGDYFSKPNTEDIFETVYQMMHEADPIAFPAL